MKTYKRFLSTIFALTLTVGVLTGCGDTAGEKSTDDTTTTTTTAAQTEDTTTTAALEETTTSVTTTVTEKETPENEADTETITEVPESSANVGIETMADNPDGMYPMEECFRRVIEESTNSKVISINIIEGLSSAITEDGHKFMLAPGEVSVYYNGELTNINDYVISESFLDEFDGMVSYSPNADKNG